MSIYTILLEIEESGYTIRKFLDALLTNPAYQSHPVLRDLKKDVADILELLLQHNLTKNSAVTKVFALVEERYCDEI